MVVKRAVPNIAATDLEAAKLFYGDILEMQVVMDLGWVVTFGTNAKTTPQISLVTEGGSGIKIPDISIEVDNIDEVHRRVLKAGFSIEYGLVSENWGVRRFYVRDPFGRLVNILMHAD